MAWGSPPAKRRAPNKRAAQRASSLNGGKNPKSASYNRFSQQRAPEPVLGASSGGRPVAHADTTRVNTGSPETAATGWGVERLNKRFTVGYTPDGRVVHLYGGNVPAEQRRIVLNKRR